MTIYPLQVGKTYRTRDGKAEHTIGKILGEGADAVAYDSRNLFSWWAVGGRKYRHEENINDLVEEVRPTAPTAEGPVRRRTVTEIVDGDFNRLRVSHVDHRNDEVWLGLLAQTNPDVPVFYCFSAEELDALAATATQLADALRAIAAEKNQ